MNLQPKDIVKVGNYYYKIFFTDDNFVYATNDSNDIKNLKIYTIVHAYPHDGFKDAEIIERNGKAYVPEKWKPEIGGTYFLPCFYGDRYLAVSWYENDSNHRSLEQNLVCQTPEEAIALAEKMLNAIK